MSTPMIDHVRSAMQQWYLIQTAHGEYLVANGNEGDDPRIIARYQTREEAEDDLLTRKAQAAITAMSYALTSVITNAMKGYIGLQAPLRAPS